jgi:hypothetical protein
MVMAFFEVNDIGLVKILPEGTKRTSGHFKDEVLRLIYEESCGSSDLDYPTPLTLHYDDAPVHNARGRRRIGRVRVHSTCPSPILTGSRTVRLLPLCLSSGTIDTVSIEHARGARSDHPPDDRGDPEADFIRCFCEVAESGGEMHRV